MPGSNDPLNSAGFTIPTLQQYQLGMRTQAAQKAEQASGGHPWAALMTQGAFDLARATGYLSPQEKTVSLANQIQQDAVRSSTSSDPAEARLQQLSYMAQKFNQVGLSDLAAQVMPELNALTQRKVEMRKLGAEATSAQVKAQVDLSTEGDALTKPSLDNSALIAKTAADNAKAKLDLATAGEKGGEYQNYVNPNTGAMTAVLKSNASGRAALARAGFVEDNININPAKIGDLAPPPLTKQNVTDLYKSLSGSASQLDSITAGMATFKPEYLTLPGKIVAGAQGFADKLGVTLSPTQHANLEGYQSFVSNSIRSLNQYIHDLTGAQMSQGEADRLRSAINDVQNQGPTAYISALRETVRGLLQTQARAKAWLDAAGNSGAAPPTGDEWNAISMPPIPESQVDAYMRRFGVGPRGASSSGTTPPAATASPLNAKIDSIIGNH